MIKLTTLTGLIVVSSLFIGCSATPPQPYSRQVDSLDLNETQKKAVLNKSLNDATFEDVDVNNCIFGRGRIKEFKERPGFNIFSLRSNCYEIKNNTLYKLPERFECVISDEKKYGNVDISKCSEKIDDAYWTRYITNVDSASRALKHVYTQNIKNFDYAIIPKQIEQTVEQAIEKRNELFKLVEFEKMDGFGDKIKKRNCKAYALNDEELAYFYKETWNNPLLFNMNSSFSSFIGRESQIAAAVFGASNQFFGTDFTMEDLNLQKENIKMNGKLSANAITLSLANFCLEAGKQAKRNGEFNLTLKKKHVQLIQAYFAANNLILVDAVGSEPCRYWPERSNSVLLRMVDIFSKYSRDKAVVKLVFILASDKTEEEKIQILLNQPNVEEMFSIISNK